MNLGNFHENQESSTWEIQKIQGSTKDHHKTQAENFVDK